jgi:thioredoxin 1
MKVADDECFMDEEIMEIRERRMKEFMEKREFPEKPLEVKDSDFEETVRRYPLVVVDFWSEFCPPCRLIEPVLKELAVELRGRAVFGKVCVDQERLMASKFGITAIPTLLVFREGNLIDTIIGYAPKEVLLGKLKKHLE